MMVSQYQSINQLLLLGMNRGGGVLLFISMYIIERKLTPESHLTVCNRLKIYFLWPLVFFFSLFSAEESNYLSNEDDFSATGDAENVRSRPVTICRTGGGLTPYYAG